jgi:hypothetical protein
VPKVFIIILNFNGWLDTKECLCSLEKVDYPNFEVVLIDNGSNGNYQLSVSGYQLKIQAIYNEHNFGFAGGNNQGIKLALGGGADYILLLNNDTLVKPDFLTKLVEAGEKNKEYGIIGPVIYKYNDKNKIQFAGGKINWSRTRGTHITYILSLRAERSNPVGGGNNSGLPVWHAFGKPMVDGPCARGTRDDILSVDYITGCCLLIKREVIEKIGLISEDYFLYYEDTDWNMRAQQAGYKCGVMLDVKIYHKGSASSTEFSYPYIYYHTRNGLIFSSRFGFLPLTYLISGWIFLKQLVKLAIGYKREWARPVMQGVIDFWQGKGGKLAGYY